MMAKSIQVQMWQANNGKECRLELEALIEDFNTAAVDPEEVTVQGKAKPTHEFTEAVEALHEYVNRGIQ